MNGIRHSWKDCKRWQAVLALMATAATAIAGAGDWDYYQYQDSTEPSPWPQLKYLKLDVEAERSTGSSGASGHSTYERAYIAPGIGIGWDHFIYHPDLLSFNILAEPGYRWQATDSSGSVTKQNDWIVNGTANATLLQLKPYSTTLFATAAHTIHQYDFFTSVVEDSQTYGVSSGYREGPVPVTVSFQKMYRTTSGLSYDTSSDQTTAELHAKSDRGREDTTDFSYQYSDYEGVTTDSNQKFHDSTVSHYVTLTDVEHFEKAVLNSTLLYDHLVESSFPSDSLFATLTANVDNTPQLRSFYDYSLSSYGIEGGDSLQHYARAGVGHQLYESLSSWMDLHGSTVNSSFNGSTLDSWSAGTTASFSYTKRLSPWARLTVSDTATFDFTDQESSGPSLLIPNESHTLVSGQWSRFNQPQVITIVSVTTDAAHGSLPLAEPTDYFVDRARNPWQIQLNPASVIVHSGDTVLVTYMIQPNPSGTYSTVNELAEVRLDLWDGIMGVYGRYILTQNHTDTPGFVLEDIEEIQAGMDFNRNGLRLDANYTDRKSSLYSYYAYYLSESYSLELSRQSSLGINLNQRWTYYPQSGIGTNATSQATFYSFIARYDWHPVSTFDWSVEAGDEIQRGNGFDQDLIAVRSYVKWLVGRMDLNLGYEYQNQTFTGDTRERHFVFLRARRNF